MGSFARTDMFIFPLCIVAGIIYLVRFSLSEIVPLYSGLYIMKVGLGTFKSCYRSGMSNTCFFSAVC